MPRSPARASSPGSGSPSGPVVTPQPTGDDFTFRATGFRPEWGAPRQRARLPLERHPLSLRAPAPQPVPRHGRRVRAGRGRHVDGEYPQAFQDPAEPGRWRHRWVRARTSLPSLEQPYEGLGEIAAPRGLTTTPAGSALSRYLASTPASPPRREGSVGTYELGIPPETPLTAAEAVPGTTNAKAAPRKPSGTTRYNLRDYALGPPGRPPGGLPLSVPVPAGATGGLCKRRVARARLRAQRPPSLPLLGVTLAVRHVGRGRGIAGRARPRSWAP